MFEDSLFSTVLTGLATPSTYLGAVAGASAREIWKFSYQFFSILSGLLIVGSTMKSHPRIVGALVLAAIALLALSGCASVPDSKSQRDIVLTGAEYCDEKRSALRGQLELARECRKTNYEGCEKTIGKLKELKSQYSDCRSASLDNNVLTHPANIFRSTNGN